MCRRNRAALLARVRGTNIPREELRGIIRDEVGAMDVEDDLEKVYDDLPPLSEADYEELMSLLLRDFAEMQEEQYLEYERFEEEMIQATVQSNFPGVYGGQDDAGALSPMDLDD